VRTGLVAILPSLDFEDEQIERILQEYIENEMLEHLSDDDDDDDTVPDPIMWPTQDPQPINEYNTEGYTVMAFPSLFPTGRADFRDRSQRTDDLGLAEYFEALMRFKDGRFGRHPRYIAFCMRLIWVFVLGIEYEASVPSPGTRKSVHEKVHWSP